MANTKTIIHSLEKERSLYSGYATLAGIWVFASVFMDVIVFPIDLIARIALNVLLIVTLACLHRTKDELIRQVETNRNTGYRVRRQVWRRWIGRLAVFLYVLIALVTYANQMLPTWLRATIAGILTILLFRLRLTLLVRKETEDKPTTK